MWAWPTVDHAGSQARLGVTGLDLDPAMIERALKTRTVQRAATRAGRRFSSATSPHWRSPTDRSTWWSARCSMHHWADPTAGLAEIGRVLRPGGRALVWDFRAGPVPLHGHLPDPVEHAHGSPLHVVDATPWRWPWRFNLIRRIELVRAVDVSPPCGNVDPGPTRRPASTDKPPTSGGEVLDTVILAIATALAVVGVGGLIVDGVRAARADGGRRFSADLGWTLLWAAGLSALFVAAWATRR